MLALLIPALTATAARADNHWPHAALDPLAADGYRVSEPACFGSSGSSDSDGQLTTWAWDFGDGATTTGNDSAPCHTYVHPGWYILKLVVTDNEGAVGSATNRLLVHSLAPIAGFGQTPTRNTQERQFDASASADPDGGIVGYSWDFGDGTTGAGRNPVHRYAAPGAYPVTLKVTDNMGDTATVTQTVPIVIAAPTATITGAARHCAGERYRIEVDAADAEGHVADFQWDLDGKPGYEFDTFSVPNTGVTFGAGPHRVGVQATDDSGLVAEASADLVFVDCRPTVRAPRALRLRDRGVSLAITCMGPCLANAQLVSGSRRVGAGVAKLTAAGSASVRVEISPKVARSLKVRRLDLVVRVTEPNGVATTVMRKLTVAASHARSSR